MQPPRGEIVLADLDRDATSGVLRFDLAVVRYEIEATVLPRHVTVLADQLLVRATQQAQQRAARRVVIRFHAFYLHRTIEPGHGVNPTAPVDLPVTDTVPNRMSRSTYIDAVLPSVVEVFCDIRPPERKGFDRLNAGRLDASHRHRTCPACSTGRTPPSAEPGDVSPWSTTMYSVAMRYRMPGITDKPTQVTG